MPYTLQVTEAEISARESYVNAKGNTECVECVRQTTAAPATFRWHPGQHVQEAKLGQIARGTAIATFDDKGRYPNDGKGRHAAIYLSHDKTGIVVLDQWNSKGKVSRRTIRFNTKSYSRSNEGTTFYVIE
ncbi:BPSL0067 family protein [Massilia sp. BJB1822]|uniref:BPSL0067 family protein n=1 Tax=Massilia sp. BJB1822 TaxID=2744470 RepID=UPI001593F29E|nr:BPSL0067 family protein [Massilia sp. BJB1822]NVD97537.1 BPSL0067 family protein [Massilia sp. BJB1822]